MVNLYTASYCMLARLEEVGKKEDELDNDMMSDLKVLVKELFNRLDPSIRYKMNKRGISFIFNIYTGFDTEYKGVDFYQNNLLSVQLAVNTKINIKIPIHEPYTMSSVHTLTNKVYSVRSLNDFRSDVLEMSVNNCINTIRRLRFGSYDESMRIIVEGLKSEGFDYFEKDCYVVFGLPRSDIQPYIYYNYDGINYGPGYDLLQLVEESNKMGQPHLSKRFDELIALLKNIYENRMNDNGVKPDCSTKKEEGDYIDRVKILDPIVVDVKTIERLSVASNGIEQLTESEEFIDSEISEGDVAVDSTTDASTDTTTEMFRNVQDDTINKKVSPGRGYMTSFSNDRVSVTRICNIYIAAHLTNADLSMLNDFNDFKDDLSIINKNFATLGRGVDLSKLKRYTKSERAMKLKGCNIYIRDTMLLSPAGKNSLNDLGKLYGAKLHKKSLSKEQIENMDLLLVEDKKLFQEYAVRDAIITLVHCN